MRLPDFFIVGHAKCGTTALYEMLRRHPQIHMPAKEPRFFAIKEIDMRAGGVDDADRADGVDGTDGADGADGVDGVAGVDGVDGVDGGAGDAQRVPGKRPRTLHGYAKLFAAARGDQIVGEATPAYLRSTLAAERIAAVRPDARIVAILREPTSFLRSFHLQSVRGYNETETDFQKAIALVEPRRQGRQVPRLSRTPDDLLYLDHVRYVEQLRRYHAAFAREQVLVLIYDDFRADNEGTVRQVLRFLHVDDSAPIAAVETARSRDVRFSRLHRLVKLRRVALRNVPAAGGLSRIASTLTPTRLRGSVRKRWRGVAYAEPTPPDEEFMRQLRSRLKPDVEALSEYLGRDLVTLWGYQDVP